MSPRRRRILRANILALLVVLVAVLLCAWLLSLRRDAGAPGQGSAQREQSGGTELTQDQSGSGELPQDSSGGTEASEDQSDSTDPTQDSSAGFAQTVESGDAGVRVSAEQGSVEQVATRLLASYQQRGDCVLASAGYLDLMGSVWGCVVQGGQWVEVCTVFEAADSASCEVRILRMDADEVAELL